MIPVYTNKPVDPASLLIEVKTIQQLEEMKKACTDKCIMMLFWAEWHEPCHILRDQMAELAKVHKEIRFAWCNSDESTELVDKFDINAVPTLAIFHPHKQEAELIENPSPDKLSQTCETQNEFYRKWFTEEQLKAFREIEDMVTQQPQFFMFIKGTPEQPKCKFTRKLLETLQPFGYRFRTFDILKDERIRQWLKFYSQWPTFPQIFLGGKFVGGVDITVDLVEAGEFDAMVPQQAKKLPPKEEFAELLNFHPVVVLLENGTADAQNNSEADKELVTMLKKNGVKFLALDLTHRKDLRDALNILPQTVFVKGTVLGDLNHLKSLGDNLVKHFPADSVVETLEQRLKKLVNQSKVMLFMKGSPKAPQCGFSQRIVNLLNLYTASIGEYGHFDIFKDEQVREGLKKYSNWPTYPQVYVNGQLIGGIDICQEMHESGELEDALLGKQ